MRVAFKTEKGMQEDGRFRGTENQYQDIFPPTSRRENKWLMESHTSR